MDFTSDLWMNEMNSLVWLGRICMHSQNNFHDQLYFARTGKSKLNSKPPNSICHSLLFALIRLCLWPIKSLLDIDDSLWMEPSISQTWGPAFNYNHEPTSIIMAWHSYSFTCKKLEVISECVLLCRWLHRDVTCKIFLVILCYILFITMCIYIVIYSLSRFIHLLM